MLAATSAKDEDAASKVEGCHRSTKSTVLETGAALTQVSPRSLLEILPNSFG